MSALFSRSRRAVSALCAMVLTGCVVPTVTWDGDGGHDGSHSTAIDGRVLARVRGTVRYRTSSGSGSQATTLRISVDPVELGDAMTSVCRPTLAWQPQYRSIQTPAPNPASYEFDGIEPGRYCALVVLDFEPFSNPGDPIGCEDLVMPERIVDVTVPLTTIPDFVLEPPRECH